MEWIVCPNASMMPRYKKRTSENSFCEQASSAHRPNMIHDDWIKSYSWCFFSTLLEKNMKEYICKIEWFPQKDKQNQHLLDPQPLGHDDHPNPSFRWHAQCLPNPWRKRPLAGNKFPPRPWRGWCEIPTGFVREMWVATKKTGGQI